MKNYLLIACFFFQMHFLFAQCQPNDADHKQGVWEPLKHQTNNSKDYNTSPAFKIQSGQILQLFKNIVPTPQGANFEPYTYRSPKGIFPEINNKEIGKLESNFLNVWIKDFYCKKGVIEQVIAGDYKYSIWVATNDLQEAKYHTSKKGDWTTLTPTGKTKQGFTIYNFQTVILCKKNLQVLLRVSRRMVLDNYFEELNNIYQKERIPALKRLLETIKAQYTEKQMEEQAFVKGGLPIVENLDKDYLSTGIRPLFNENTDGIFRLNPNYFDLQKPNQVQVILIDLNFDIEDPQRYQERHPFLTQLRENIFSKFDFSKLSEMIGN